MSSTTNRDIAVNLARTNAPAALVRARKVDDPWFRCQALAWVAWFTPDLAAFLKIIDESIKSASKSTDAYKRTAVLAWPLRALAERGCTAQAKSTIRIALATAADIENPTSKADALFLLWQAAFPLGVGATKELLSALTSSASHAVPTSKSQQLLQHALLMIVAHDKKLAQQILSGMPEGRYRRQAERLISEGQYMEPRKFFWNHSIET